MCMYMYVYKNLMTFYLLYTMEAEHNHANDSKYQQFCPLFPLALSIFFQIFSIFTSESALSISSILTQQLQRRYMIFYYVTVTYDNSLMCTQPYYI